MCTPEFPTELPFSKVHRIGRDLFHGECMLLSYDIIFLHYVQILGEWVFVVDVAKGFHFSGEVIPLLSNEKVGNILP